MLSIGPTCLLGGSSGAVIVLCDCNVPVQHSTVQGSGLAGPSFRQGAAGQLAANWAANQSSDLLDGK